MIYSYILYIAYESAIKVIYKKSPYKILAINPYHDSLENGKPNTKIFKMDAYKFPKLTFEVVGNGFEDYEWDKSKLHVRVNNIKKTWNASKKAFDVYNSYYYPV